LRPPAARDEGRKKEWQQQGAFQSDSEKGDYAATGSGREDEQGQPLKLRRVSEDKKAEFLVATRRSRPYEGSYSL